MANYRNIGFIGTGVMGGRMCRNLAIKSGASIHAFDIDENKTAALAKFGVKSATSMAAVVETADIVMMCLPGEQEVRAVCTDKGGILDHVRPGQTIVDMTTATLEVEREMLPLFTKKLANYADAPVARGVSSAEDGTLSIMVGATIEVFALIEPVLKTMGTEITLCGDVGSGQVVKLLNNMILVMNVSALAEALAIGRRAGVDGELLFKTLSRGSADSFALRKHGIQYMVRGEFPDDIFPVNYSIKDMSSALRLAEKVGVDAEGARLANKRLKQAKAEGYGQLYCPVIYKLLET